MLNRGSPGYISEDGIELRFPVRISQHTMKKYHFLINSGNTLVGFVYAACPTIRTT